MKEIMITIIIGYLLGCIQTAYFIGKFVKKTDIRTLGNGNAGASNTTAVFGWKYGIVVALVDILKPVLAIFLISYLWKSSIDSETLILLKYICGLFVILGHNFPFFMDFKGGKGTASLIGMLMAIDIRTGLIGILAIICVTLISEYIALGTIALVLVSVILTVVFGYDIFCILIMLFITIMSIYKHIPNLKNIKNGTEIRLSKVLKKEKGIKERGVKEDINI